MIRSPLQQQKGPAAAPTAPSHGSTQPQKDMDMNANEGSTAALQQQDHDALFEARDKLTRIKDLNELVFMASEGMLGTSEKAANAICAGCDTIGMLLEEVCDLIDGRQA